MNEAAGLRPSNLTDQQRQEAMESIYGLAQKDDTTMFPNTDTDSFSYEERVRLRRVLDQLDQKEAGGMKEFDLNKPPAPPYLYREYPILLYNHSTGQNRPARNYDERQRMLAEGWSENPVAPAPPEVELTPQEELEAKELTRELKKKKAS